MDKTKMIGVNFGNCKIIIEDAKEVMGHDDSLPYNAKFSVLIDDEPLFSGSAWNDGWGGTSCYNLDIPKGSDIKKVNENFKFITFGGDGGTYDIGFQSLSGALERGHDFTYFCYDNEAYMNTGIQRSSATPMFADTTTTPIGINSNGKMQYRKDLAAIIAEHQIPYVAQTTFVQNFRDLHNKAERAIYTKGSAFLNIMAPCPRGWRYPTYDIIDVCKLAVETRYWPLFEVVNGKWILNYEPKRYVPVEEWLSKQGRFKHMFKSGNEWMIEAFQNEVDRRWDELVKRCDGHHFSY